MNEAANNSQMFWYFAGLLSAWGLLIIATTRWTVSRGLAANDQRMEQMEKNLAQSKEENAKREREILQLRCDLPLEYVRREDSILQETVMSAKLDAMAAKIYSLREKKNA